MFSIPMRGALLLGCLMLGALGSSEPQSGVKDSHRQLVSAGVGVHPLRRPATTETLAAVRADIERKMARVATLSCTLELSKKREKRVRRKIEIGPLELIRGQGGRLALTRKGETEEYIANSRIVWSYDHKDKEAKYIPTNIPVISTFVQEALRLNVFMAVDEDTLALCGTQEFEGEQCWVLEGRSPSKLRAVGVPRERIRVWIAKADGLPRKINVPGGSDTTIIFRGLAVNAKLDARRFQWTPPKSVDVKNIFGF